MKTLLLCLTALLCVGCANGRMNTITAHQVVNDRNLDEPVGYFQISQTRFESSRADWDFNYRQYDVYRGSDVEVRFHNTCQHPVSFNFVLAGQGWHLRDAVVNLSPNQVYTSQRINAPYNALDFWRVTVNDVCFTQSAKRQIPVE